MEHSEPPLDPLLRYIQFVSLFPKLPKSMTTSSGNIVIMGTTDRFS